MSIEKGGPHLICRPWCVQYATIDFFSSVNNWTVLFLDFQIYTFIQWALCPCTLVCLRLVSSAYVLTAPECSSHFELVNLVKYSFLLIVKVSIAIKKMEVVVCLDRIQVFQIRVCSVSNSCQVLTSTCALFVVEGVFVRRYFGNGETTKEVRPSTGILGKAFLSMSLQLTI